MLKTLRQALFLGCFLPCIGCSRSDNAELIKAKAETDAAKADAVAARAQLAKVKAEASPANEPPKPKDKGKLEIGETYEVEFGPSSSSPRFSFDASRARIWEIRGSAVKEITVRLLIAQNGKAEVSQKIRYMWKTPMMGVKWQLCYLLQTSLTFGVEEKLFPSFSLSRAAEKESSTGDIRSTFSGRETLSFLPGKGRVGTHPCAASKLSVEPEKQQIVYGELRENAKTELEGMFKGPLVSVDDFAKASIEGRSAVVLVLEWK